MIRPADLLNRRIAELESVVAAQARSLAAGEHYRARLMAELDGCRAERDRIKALITRGREICRFGEPEVDAQLAANIDGVLRALRESDGVHPRAVVTLDKKQVADLEFAIEDLRHDRDALAVLHAEDEAEIDQLRAEAAGLRKLVDYWADKAGELAAENVRLADLHAGAVAELATHICPDSLRPPVADAATDAPTDDGDVVLYVASRASVPDRPAMWRDLRDGHGWRISSSWIDEAGEGETADFGELWTRIEGEVRQSDGLILYAHADDFPLKGALVEAGIAIGMGKPVAVVLSGPSILEPRSLRPLGSWAKHPMCRLCESLDAARAWIRESVSPGGTGIYGEHLADPPPPRPGLRSAYAGIEGGGI
jgi:hypothetical protein